MSQRHRTSSIITRVIPLMVVALLCTSTALAQQRPPDADANNNFKDIVLAMLQYHGAKGGFPAAANHDKDGKPLLSWRVHILPYMGQEALYRQFKLDEPWDSEHNHKLIARIPTTYVDPGVDGLAAKGKTTYVVPLGEGTIIEPRLGKKMSSIKDGTSNTVLVVDVAPENAVIWTKPADWNFVAKEPGKGLVEGKRKQFRVAYADGRVNTLPIPIDLDDLRRLMQCADGEPLSKQY